MDEIFKSNTTTMWMSLLAMCFLWAMVSVVKIIVDGIVKTRQHRADMERECFTRVLQDLEEVKERLNHLKQGRPGA